MATDKVSKVILQWEVQKQKLAEVRQSAIDIRKDFDLVGTGAVKAGDRAEQFGRQLGDLRERISAARGQNTELRASFLGLDTSLTNAANGSISLTGNLAKVREEIKRTQDAADAAGPSLDALTGGGRGSSNGRALGQAESGINQAAQLLPGGSGELARTLGDVVGSVQKLPELKNVLKELSPTTVGAGVAIAGLSVVLVALQANAKAAKEAAEAELAGRRRAIELITVGTQQEIQLRINELEKKRKADQAAADDANAFLANLRVTTFETYGALNAGLSEINATLGTNSGELSAAKEAADAANKAIGQTSTELTLLQQASGLTAQSTSDLIAQEQQLTEVRKKLTDFAENASDLKQILDLEANGTSVDAINELAEAKRREIEVNKFYRQASLDLAATLEVGTDAYKEAIAEADKYGEAITRDTNFLDRLALKTYEIVGAHERELKTLDLVAKYNDETSKATETYYQRRAEIEESNNQKLIDLAVKKAEAEENALGKLTDKIAALDLAAQRAVEDAATKQQRQELAAQEKLQRAEAKAARDHANTLIKIQQDANNKAEDLIAQRDFAGLFRLRRDTGQQLAAENDKYKLAAEDRVENAKQERDDRLKTWAREAEDRQKKYSRDLTDARSQYNRELSDVNAKYIKALTLQQQAGQAELNLLQSKYQAEVNLRNQTVQKELELIQLGNIARLKLQEQFNAKLLEQAARLLQGNFGEPTTGGISGTGVGFGIGAGGFGGISNQSNKSQSNTFNINGQNAQGIGNAVGKIIVDKLGFFFN